MIRKYGADITARNIHGECAFDLLEEKSETKWSFLNPDASAQPSVDVSRTVSNDDEENTAEVATGFKISLRKISQVSSTPSQTPTSPKAKKPKLDLPANSNKKLIASLGLVSNQNLLRSILPADVFSHSIVVDAAVRNINFRVLLNRPITSNAVRFTHNRADVKPIRESEANIHDYCISLIRGLNFLEVISGRESLVVFINRIE